MSFFGFPALAAAADTASIVNGVLLAVSMAALLAAWFVGLARPGGVQRAPRIPENSSALPLAAVLFGAVACSMFADMGVGAASGTTFIPGPARVHYQFRFRAGVARHYSSTDRVGDDPGGGRACVQVGRAEPGSGPAAIARRRRGRSGRRRHHHPAVVSAVGDRREGLPERSLPASRRASSATCPGRRTRSAGAGRDHHWRLPHCSVMGRNCLPWTHPDAFETNAPSGLPHN